jgi:hypothetical protein
MVYVQYVNNEDVRAYDANKIYIQIKKHYSNMMTNVMVNFEVLVFLNIMSIWDS